MSWSVNPSNSLANHGAGDPMSEVPLLDAGIGVEPAPTIVDNNIVEFTANAVCVLDWRGLSIVADASAAMHKSRCESAPATLRSIWIWLLINRRLFTGVLATARRNR